MSQSGPGGHQFMSNDMGGPGSHLSQVSPHPVSSMAMSPIINSPNLMKSPIQGGMVPNGGQLSGGGSGQFMPMSGGHPGGMQQPMSGMDQHPGGPPSAGATPGADWNSLNPQSSMVNMVSRNVRLLRFINLVKRVIFSIWALCNIGNTAKFGNTVKLR